MRSSTAFGVVVALIGYYGAIVQYLIAIGRTRRSSRWLYLQTDNTTAQKIFAGVVAALATVILAVSVA